MPISIPKFFQRAFAQNGGKQDVPITGDNSGGRASYDVGFPPVTRIPIVAGGIPPFGTDFNGVLYDLSQAIQYVQSGVAFPFNQDFATAIGGYEIGAIVSDSSNKSLLWINVTASNTSFPAGWTQFSFKNSTETIQGTIRVGTQAEVNAGTIDDAAITPKKFVEAFKGSALSLYANGYQRLPSGLIVQWGANIFNTTETAVTFPIAFPNEGFCVLASNSTNTPSVTVSAGSLTKTGFKGTASVGGSLHFWIAFGR